VLPATATLPATPALPATATLSVEVASPTASSPDSNGVNGTLGV